MNSFRHASRIASIAVVAALALPAIATANHAAMNGKDALVAVYDARYVAGGRVYESLDALEQAVRAARPTAVLVVACTPASAPAWLAAVPRFDDIPMHLDVAVDASPQCPAIPVRTAMASSAPADPAVDQYWSRRMP
jgi:hypothetical protein